MQLPIQLIEVSNGTQVPVIQVKNSGPSDSKDDSQDTTTTVPFTNVSLLDSYRSVSKDGVPQVASRNGKGRVWFE